MGAPKNNQFAIGNSGGKPYSKENREKAATLKGLLLDWCLKTLQAHADGKKVKPEDLKLIRERLLITCIPKELDIGGQEEKPIPILAILKKENDNENVL
jgi:hypothetical protein